MPTAPPPTCASVKLQISMPVRGVSTVWSNRYYLGSLTTLNTTTFNNLADDISNKFKAVISAWCGIVGAVGYDAGSDTPVFSKTYAISGTFAHTGERLCPADAAAMIRFSTTQRSAKNHPIYLYKWVHGVYYDDATQPDTLWSTQKSALETYAGQCVTGFNDGTTNHPISGPYGAVAQGHQVSQWIRHRDFPNPVSG